MKEFLNDVNKYDIGKVSKDVFLSKYTTYKVGGMVRAIIYPKNIDKLVKLRKLIKKHNIKYQVLGKGSNVLFSDKIYEGVLIKLDELDKIEFIDNKVICGAGASLMKVSREAIKKGLAGLEFASGIPGSVGGAIYMNAGAYNSDMGYITKSVKVLTDDLKIITLTNKEMDFHYRSSILQKKKDYICLEATLKLQKGNKTALEEVIRDRKERRVASQPLEYPSAGSVFRNKEGCLPSGKLIEDLGLKGLTKGGAEVSLKHANFIINKREASAQDIHDLILFVHDAVLDNYGIDLKIEQEFINWE